MAKDTASVKVRLDTKKAKGDLRDLNRSAEASAGRIRPGAGGRGGGGGGALFAGAIGGFAGAAMAGARGGLGGGISDIAGGAINPLWATLKSKIFGGKDLEATAAKEAASSMPFRLIGARGEVPAGIIPLFQARKARILQRLEGQRLVEKDTRFGGPGGEAVESVKTEAGKRVMQAGIQSAITGRSPGHELIRGAVKDLVEALREFKYGGRDK